MYEDILKASTMIVYLEKGAWKNAWSFLLLLKHFQFELTASYHNHRIKRRWSKTFLGGAQWQDERQWTWAERWKIL